MFKEKQKSKSLVVKITKGVNHQKFALSKGVYNGEEHMKLIYSKYK
jgi:hypothetical protein